MAGRRRYPKLPISASKATMRLLTAVVAGNEDLANWVSAAYDDNQITGTRVELKDLKRRLDEALEPITS
jgi:hypothetical protein